MISAQNIVKHYDQLVAVNDVTFDIQRGEIVGLLGHNGAGKTTVMKMMTGYLEPTRGRISVGGIDVTEDRIGVQRQIGYMPESAPLYREMLVQEYLIMMAELRGLRGKEKLNAVMDAVEATGLGPRLTQSIGTLSKGYRQRVGLAQAILHRPEVLVLDEPTNGLDPVQIVEIRELIRRLARTTTVILSTHILSEIEAVCNRVIILIDGMLAADASLESLLSSSEVRLSIETSATDIEDKLKGLPGVVRVDQDTSAGSDGLWRIHCEKDADPTPAIARLALDEDWKLGGVAPIIPSLEQVFRDLMAEHVARAQGGDGS